MAMMIQVVIITTLCHNPEDHDLKDKLEVLPLNQLAQ
jgi:hypothetical protein